MSFPVQLSDLPSASVALDSDLTLLRNGLTDYQVTIQKIRQIDISGLPTLPFPPQQTDYMMVQQNGMTGQVFFGQVGFSQGTQMWFYQDVNPSPMFWMIVSGGDNLIAVKGGITYTVGGTVQGTWQQRDVGGLSGQGLTINQMPAHAHGIQVRDDDGFSSNSLVRSTKASGASSKLLSADGTGPIQLNGSASGTGGTSLPHNHGNNWRPLAAVGIICRKQQ